MSWGAMGGIGAALTNLSANMAEMDKAKLRDKLETDREVARETREAAKLKRTTSYRKLTNGKWQSYNADDELLRETAATSEEITKAKQDAEIAELDIRSKRATAEATETELAWAKADRNLLTPEQRALAAKIKAGLELSAAEKEQARRWGLEYAQRDRHHSENVSARKAGLEGRLSSKDDGKPTELSAVARQLRQDYDKMVTSLMEDTTVNLTESEAQELARNSAVAAVREGKDFGDVYRRALMNFADQRRAGRK